MKKKYNPANKTKRFASFLLDFYICGLLMSIYTSFVSFTKYSDVRHQNLLEYDTNIMVKGLLISCVILFLYYVIIPTFLFKGQTIAKKLFSLKIVKDDETDITIQDILKRYLIGFTCLEGVFLGTSTLIMTLLKSKFFNISSELTNIIYVLWIVISVFSSILVIMDKKPVHDLVAGTKVVSIKIESSLNTIRNYEKNKIKHIKNK